MKRFFTMIVAACAFFATMAQHPMVTLSHNGELSFFTNLNAFKAAVDSAQNGDILYLSKGNFIISGGEMTIEKRLSIVGNGYESHIMGDLIIDMFNNIEYHMDAPLFDGVRLDALSFGKKVGCDTKLGETEVRRCWIRSLESSSYGGTDLTVDQCFIESIAHGASSNNTLIINSKIKSIDDIFVYKLNFINCNIDYTHYLPMTTVSCIINNSEPLTTYGNYNSSVITSLFRVAPQDSDNIHTNDNYVVSDDVNLLNESLDSTIDLEAAGFLGQDGTVVGIYGGETPFSENPSVPTVDTSKSSVEYDAENNKLKVSITVKAD